MPSFPAFKTKPYYDALKTWLTTSLNEDGTLKTSAVQAEVSAALASEPTVVAAAEDAAAAAVDDELASNPNLATVNTPGAEGEVLTVVSGVPDWAPPTGGGDPGLEGRVDLLETQVNAVYDPIVYGAIADGASHPLSERYATLAEAQAVYPHAAALTDEIDWCALQAASNDLIASDGGRIEAHGQFVIHKPVSWDVGTGNNLAGRAFIGSGRDATTIKQTADNQPIFILGGLYVHSLTFSGFGATWGTAADAAKTNRVVFRVNGTSSASFYNSTISDLRMTKGHTLIASTTMLTWGLWFRDIMQTDCSGKFWDLKGATGEPNIRVESVYILASTMVGPIFDGFAVTASMDNVEVNQSHLSAKMIADNAGGTYHIGLFGLEGGTYANGSILFDVTNGRLQARRVHITIETTGSSVIAFNAGGGKNNRMDIDALQLNISGSGNFYVGQVTGNPGDHTGNYSAIQIGTVRHMSGSAWSEPAPSRLLANSVMTASANAISIREWNDGTRVAFRGDADLTLAQDDPALNVFRTVTAPRTVTLPHIYESFSGRRFTISKLDATSTLTIRKHDSSLIVTLASGSKGKVELVYNRSLVNGPSNNWTVVDSTTWT